GGDVGVSEDIAEPNRDLLPRIWGEILTIVEPVLAADDPWRRARLMRAIGWDLEAITGRDAAAFEDWVMKIGPALTALTELLHAKPDWLAALDKAAGAAGRALGVVLAMPPTLRDLLYEDEELSKAFSNQLLAELGEDLLDYLILTYLRRRVPWMVPLLTLL